MAISTVTGADVLQHNQILDILCHRLPPEEFKNLVEGKYKTECAKNGLTGEIIIAVLSNGKVIHKEIISENALPEKPSYQHDDAADAASYHEAATKEEYEKWYQKNSANPEKKVSNKFLPFIVESSTPVHIFKTLLSRSKGMNEVIVASIFNLTLNVKIKTLREFVKSLPELPLESTYEELLTKWPQYRIKDESLQLFRAVHKHILLWMDSETSDMSLWDAVLDEFDKMDVMMFFCVVSLAKNTRHDYSKHIQYQRLHEFDKISKNLTKHIKLSDDGHKIHLSSGVDIAAFIMFNVVVLPQLPDSKPPPTYCLVYS